MGSAPKLDEENVSFLLKYNFPLNPQFERNHVIEIAELFHDLMFVCNRSD